MPAVKTGFSAPPMPGMPAPMGGMAPMPGMAPMGQPMAPMGMGQPPMPPAPPMGGMPQSPMAPSMVQGSGQMQGFSMGAPRRRRFGDYLETTLGRFSQPVAADSMGSMNVFTGQMPMQAPMQRPVVGMKRGGLAGGDVEAPRRAVIKGQDHMLAYITPEEAGILKARGGWGGPGPRGIPSYPEAAAAEGGYGLGVGEAFGGGVSSAGGGSGGSSASSGEGPGASAVGGAFGGGGPGDFGRDGPGFDAFGDVYGSPAAAAVADAVAEAAATAANVGMGQAGTGGYGAQAAADVAAAMGFGPSAQTSVSQPSMSVVDQLSMAMNPSAPSSMLDTFDPEVSFGMTAPSISAQSVSSPSAPSVDVSPASMSMSQSIASDMAQDMMGLSASQAAQATAQNVSDIGRQVDVDAAMNRGGLRSGNFGPGIPGGTVSSANLGLGNMATFGVPGGTGSVSTNVGGNISPAQASGIVSAIGDISRGTGSNVAANEAAAAQMAMNQGITAEDVAMSQPVSVAPGNLAPSNAVTGLDVDMSQDVMGLLGDIAPTAAAASAPSISTTGAPATSADIAGMINAVESEVSSKGGLTSDRAAEIAANFGVPASEVTSTAAAMSRGTASAAPAATTAPSISSGIDRGLAQAAAAQAIADTVATMGPLGGGSDGRSGQIGAIASEFGLSPSEVSGLAGPSVSAQGVAPSASQDQAQVDAAIASGRQAVSQAPSMTDETDPSSAINQDRAQYNPQSLAQQQSTTVNDVIDQVQTAMQNLDPEPSTAESIFGGILNGLTYGLINTDTLVSNRVDAAQAALDGYKSGKGMGDYGVPGFDAPEAGEGPDRSCPPGFVYNASTRSCVPIGSMSSTPTAGDIDVTDSESVGGINVPVRPVETFEDVMARISSGAPTIAPLGQPLRMQAGGAVGLNRAADSFLKALAG